MTQTHLVSLSSLDLLSKLTGSSLREILGARAAPGRAGARAAIGRASSRDLNTALSLVQSHQHLLGSNLAEKGQRCKLGITLTVAPALAGTRHCC